MNPYLMEVMLKERRKEMLQEAERLRLVAIFEANNPAPKGRLIIAIGNFLIRAGQVLKQRYEPSVELTTKLCKE